ncbi:hypothetical protein KIL84_005516 [Mauremys mutica]|uniref:Uncharacterized protein n=1 Tax=Mauremys mutica TaxID=74926 RepID=A0A9D3XMI6_9SAUR|nr:hypothetical protein KIL84_005516 [Mauremys mutica]
MCNIHNIPRALNTAPESCTRHWETGATIHKPGNLRSECCGQKQHAGVACIDLAAAVPVEVMVFCCRCRLAGPGSYWNNKYPRHAHSEYSVILQQIPDSPNKQSLRPHFTPMTRKFIASSKQWTEVEHLPWQVGRKGSLYPVWPWLQKALFWSKFPQCYFAGGSKARSNRAATTLALQWSYRDAPSPRLRTRPGVHRYRSDCRMQARGPL